MHHAELDPLPVERWVARRADHLDDDQPPSLALPVELPREPIADGKGRKQLADVRAIRRTWHFCGARRTTPSLT